MHYFREQIPECKTPELDIICSEDVEDGIKRHDKDYNVTVDTIKMLSTILRYVYKITGKIELSSDNFTKIKNGFNLVLPETTKGKIDIRARIHYDYYYPSYITIGTTEKDVDVVRYFEDSGNGSLFQDVVSKTCGRNDFTVCDWPQTIQILSQGNEISISSENRKLTEEDKITQLQALTLAGALNVETETFVRLIESIYGLSLKEFGEIEILIANHTKASNEVTGSISIEEGKLCTESFHATSGDRYGNVYAVSAEEDGTPIIEQTLIGDYKKGEEDKVEAKYSRLIKELI